MKKIKRLRKDQILLFLLLMFATFATMGFELFVAEISLKTVLSMKVVVVVLNFMIASYYDKVNQYFQKKSWHPWLIETTSSLVVLGGGYILKISISAILGLFIPLFELTVRSVSIGILGSLVGITLFAAFYQRFLRWVRGKVESL